MMCQLKQNLQVKLFGIKGHNPQSSNCSQSTTQNQGAPPGMERNDGESGASLQCRTITLVLIEWDYALATPSSPFFPTLMYIPVCRGFRGNLTHGYKSLKLQKHMASKQLLTWAEGEVLIWCY